MWVELQFHYYDAVLTFSSQEAATIHRDCFIDLSENCTHKETHYTLSWKHHSSGTLGIQFEPGCCFNLRADMHMHVQGEDLL